MSKATFLMPDIWYELNIKKGDGTRIIWFKADEAQWAENNIPPLGRFLFIHASLVDKKFLRPLYVRFYLTDYRRTEPAKRGTAWGYIPAEIDVAELLLPLWYKVTDFQEPFTWDVHKDDFGNPICDIEYPGGLSK
jgi:hypothetical protein